MQSNLIPSNRKPVLIWLWFCLGMVTLMVVVGGLTRLTESGLSMVEWKPTTILPPLSHAAWQEEFSKYQHSPQYKKVNHGMTLSEFQGIFWLEYIHRLLGRLTGFIFLLPFLFFLARKMLPPPLAWRLAGIFLLGGLQGVIGWYMVKSGLVDQPWVSPVRLAMHLGLAVIIFGLLWWLVLCLSQWERPKDAQRISGEGPHPARSARRPLPMREVIWLLALILLYLQILLGALVAGMDAGLLYNTFPDMNGEWLPDGIWLLEPWYRNLAENPTCVHFLHRLGALITTIAILVAALPGRAWDVLAVLALQIALGALTVTHGIPIALASAHQAVALLFFALVIQRLYANI